MSNRHMKTGSPIWLVINITFLTLFWQLALQAETPAAGVVASAQETMTLERFREVAAAPGDNVPLGPKLASVPFWTHAAVSNVMTYASGKVEVDHMAVTARTVGGKYIVFTVYSELYHQTITTIVAYDNAASALKTYALYNDGQGGGDMVIAATVIYDYDKKTYTIWSVYGDGFKEITKGSYTSKEDVARTTIYKNDVLVLSREVITRPLGE